MIGILDTGGNYGSLLCAFEKLALPAEITGRVAASHSHLVLPGVGRADTVVGRLKCMGLFDLIPSLSIPVLGICCGYHVLCKSSEEGPVECVGMFPLEVVQMDRPRHGWREVDGKWFFFTHGYIPRTVYGQTAALDWEEGNFKGIQWHPEKSGTAGLEFLKEWARSNT